MNTPLPFDEAVDLLAQRLPARALEAVIEECELNEHVLFELNVHHDSIVQILQEQGVRERVVVVEEAKKLGVTPNTDDAFSALDAAWRGTENPFIPYVLEVLERIKMTLSLS